MSKKNLTKKQIESDVVHEMGEDAIEYWDLHRQKILYIVAAVALVFVLFRISSCISTQSQMKAAATMSELQADYVKIAGDTEQDEAQKDLDTLLTRCDEVVKKYGSDPVGIQALYVKGNALLLVPDLDKARAAFEALLEKASKPSDQAKAQIAIAATYADQLFMAPENKDLMNKAKAAYEAAIKLGTNKDAAPDMHARQAMMGLGKLYEQVGDYAAARKAYQDLVDKAPEFENMDENLDEEGISADEQNVRAFRNALRNSSRSATFKRQAENRIKYIEGIIADQQ